MNFFQFSSRKTMKALFYMHVPWWYMYMLVYIISYMCMLVTRVSLEKGFVPFGIIYSFFNVISIHWYIFKKCILFEDKCYKSWHSSIFLCNYNWMFYSYFSLLVISLTFKSTYIHLKWYIQKLIAIYQNVLFVFYIIFY